jgi:hypothetical protein
LDGGFDEGEGFSFGRGEGGEGHAVPEFGERGEGGDDLRGSGAFDGMDFEQAAAGVCGFGEEFGGGAGGCGDAVAIFEVLAEDDGDAVTDFGRRQGGDGAVELAEGAEGGGAGVGLEFGTLGTRLEEEPEGEAEHGDGEQATDDPDPGGDFDRDGREVGKLRMGERLEGRGLRLAGGLGEEEEGEHQRFLLLRPRK